MIAKRGCSLRTSERTDGWDHPRNPDACQRFGSLCCFYGVCCGEASLDDPSLFKRLTWVHPELDPSSSAAIAKRITHNEMEVSK